MDDIRNGDVLSTTRPLRSRRICRSSPVFRFLIFRAVSISRLRWSPWTDFCSTAWLCVLTWTLAGCSTPGALQPNPEPGGEERLGANGAPQATANAIEAPPVTRQLPVTERLHGIEITDPFRWLEDGASSETREWIRQQNLYSDQLLQSFPGQDRVARRLGELGRINSIGAPERRGGLYFFRKREADQDLWVICMRRGVHGDNEVLIDPHSMSDDLTTSVRILDVSGDASILAYGIRRAGADEEVVRFFDVEARRNLADILPAGRVYGVSLLADGSGVFYTRHNDSGPRVYFYSLSTGSEEQVVFGEGYGKEVLLASNLSEDERYLTVNVLHGSAARKTDIYLIDRSRADRRAEVVVTGISATFFGGVLGDRLVIQTTWDAPNGRLFAADPQFPGLDHWTEIIPERSDATVKSVSGAGGKLFVRYLEDVRYRAEIFELDGTTVGEISFGALGSITHISGEWGASEAFFSFHSFHVPPTIYRYDTRTGESTVWSRSESPVASERYVLRQVWFESKDGTDVPMFVLHAKDLVRDGSQPVLLTGYGGFNSTQTPFYSTQAVAWVEAGGIYAVANVRGGGELGDAWHRGGMLENKQNVFDDFIAAAEWLIAEGYTQPSKIATVGSSNGGLLVAASAVQRPDLFRAVVCTYPLLDMLRYHKFLAGRFWISELGSADDPEQFDYLHAYSPYHRAAEPRAYPAMFFVTGDSDTRVAPLHARKMTARVQGASTSGRPVMLRYHSKAGHATGRSRTAGLQEQSEILSFLFWQLGVEPKELGA